MSQKEKEYVLGNQLLFSNGGEVELLHDERFERLLNNSFGLTADQFQIIDAIAQGRVDTDAEEISIPARVLDADAFFLFQPAMKGRQEGQPPIRDHLVVAAVIPSRKRIHRIYIRAAEGLSIDQILGYRRAFAFVHDVKTRLETQAIVAQARKPRAPRRDDGPRRSHHNAGPRREQPAGQAPHQPFRSQMGDNWPTSAPAGRGNKRDNRDRRHRDE